MAKRKTKKSWLHRKLKLSHHRHTGRLLARHHTSYGVLMFLMLFTAVILGYATKVQADTLSDQKLHEVQSITHNGQVTLNGQVALTPQNSRNPYSSSPGSTPSNQIPGNSTSNAPTSSSEANLYPPFSWSVDSIWLFFLIVFFSLSLFWLGERFEYEKLKPRLWKKPLRS